MKVFVLHFIGMKDIIDKTLIVNFPYFETKVLKLLQGLIATVYRNYTTEILKAHDYSQPKGFVF